MATAANVPVSPEEYLERERKAGFRSEYFHGQIIAMAGGSRRHGRIVTNFVRELGQQLRTRDCGIYSSDMRVSVSKAGLYAYPDIVVTCGEEKFVDGTFDTLLNPAVIVEVLSESTKSYDRGQKFECYALIDSLSEYILIAQDKTHIEQCTRQPDEHWLRTEYTEPESRLSLMSIGVNVQLSEVYEKVQFEPR